ncbi:MAG: O-antigen ligase family protein [bacterium]|nr:O-antigen ligase family protein [bacterium]
METTIDLEILGLLYFAVLFLIGIIKPLWLVYLLLATGCISLSIFTDYKKVLFSEFGGIDFDGITLISTVSSLALGIFLRFMRKIPLTIYLLFLTFSLFSLSYSISKLDGLRLFFKLCYPYLIFVTIYHFSDESIKKSIEKSIVYGAIFVIATSFILLLFENPFVYRGPEIYPRFKGISDGSTTFASYSGVISIFLYGKYLFHKKKVYIMLFFCFFIFVFLALQRTQIFALITSIILLTILSGRKLIIFLIIVMSFTMSMILKKQLIYRMTKTTEDIPLNEIFKRIHTYGRDYLWKKTFNIFKENKFFGAGLGSTQKYLEDEVPHNEYLRILADTGITGFILFILTYIFLLKKCIFKFKISKSQERLYPAIAIAGILNYFLVNIFDNGIDWYKELSQYVWAYIALSTSKNKN